MEELEEIINDLSLGGKYSEFYENLQRELDKYSDERIEHMKGTLIYVCPEHEIKINKYDKMRVLYEYSLLI